MAPHRLDDQALIELFYELRRRGYPLAPQQLAQARALLSLIETSEAELTLLLTPVLAKSASQQAEIQAIVRSRVTGLNRDPSASRHAPSVNHPSGLEKPQTHRRRHLGILSLLTTAALFILFLVPHFMPVATSIHLTHASARPQGVGKTLESYVNATIANSRLPSPFLRVALASIPLFLVLAWWGLRMRSGRNILGPQWTESDLDRFDLGARTINLQLFMGSTLAQAARQWRRFQLVPTMEVDVGPTITATIANGGLLTPVMAKRPLAPNYLLLIEEQGRHDHVARLIDTLCNRLIEEGVSIRRYYHGDGFEALRCEGEGAEFVGLGEIDATARDTLILIGSGGALFDSLTGVARSRPLAEMMRWQRRVLLSTIPIEGWRDHESALLDVGFVLGPADEEGIVALGLHIARGFPSHINILKAARFFDAPPVPVERPTVEEESAAGGNNALARIITTIARDIGRLSGRAVSDLSLRQWSASAWERFARQTISARERLIRALRHPFQPAHLVTRELTNYQSASGAKLSGDTSLHSLSEELHTRIQETLDRLSERRSGVSSEKLQAIQALLKRDELEAALDRLDDWPEEARALDASPIIEEIRTLLPSPYHERRRLEQVVSDIREMAQRSPDNEAHDRALLRASVELARRLRADGNFPLARRWFDEAGEIAARNLADRPDNPGWTAELSSIYQEMNEIRHAR